MEGVSVKSEPLSIQEDELLGQPCSVKLEPLEVKQECPPLPAEEDLKMEVEVEPAHVMQVTPDVHQEASKAPTQPRKVTPCGCSSTDRCPVAVLVNSPLEERTEARVSEFMRQGRPKPDHGLLTRDHRWGWYDQATWLTSCSATKALYCWPCLLFARERSLWNGQGFTEFQFFYKHYKKHQITEPHLDSILSMTLRENKSTEELTDRVLRSVRTLLEVVARVPWKRVPDPAVLYALAHLPVPAVPPRDFFHACLDALSASLLRHIKAEVSEAPAVVIILDQVSANKMSVVFRFADRRGRILERFAGLRTVEDNMAIFGLLYGLKKDFQINTKVLAMCLGRLRQISLLPRENNTLLLHSPSHNLSDSLVSSLTHIKECNDFFFNWRLLKKCLGRQDVRKLLASRMLQVSNWDERLFDLVQEHRSAVEEVLQEITSNKQNWDCPTVNAAATLVQAFNDPEFLFLLSVLTDLLRVPESLLKTVESHVMDSERCKSAVFDYLKLLRWRGQKFEEMWEQTNVSVSARMLRYYKDLYATIVTTLVKQVEIRFNCMEKLGFTGMARLPTNDWNSQSASLHAAFPPLELPRLKATIEVASSLLEYINKDPEQILENMVEEGTEEVLDPLRRLCRVLLALPYPPRPVSEPVLEQDKLSSLASLPDGEALLAAHRPLLVSLLDTDLFMDHALSHLTQHNPQLLV